MAPPSEQDPVSPSVNLSHQKASISLLSLSLRGQAEWNHNHRKWTNLITRTTNSMNEPCCVGPPKMEGSWWRVLKKCGQLVKWMANHFLPWEPYEHHEKAKRYDTERWTSQVVRCPICYWRSGEIVPQRMKRQGQSKNSVQLWMWLVIKVKSDSLKNNVT